MIVSTQCLTRGHPFALLLQCYPFLSRQCSIAIALGVDKAQLLGTLSRGQEYATSPQTMAGSGINVVMTVAFVKINLLSPTFARCFSFFACNRRIAGHQKHADRNLV